MGWDESFLRAIGFEEGELGLAIGETVSLPGQSVSGGVGERAAAVLGLRVGTAIAVGMIDAHAGGVGCLGASLPSQPKAAQAGKAPLPEKAAHPSLFLQAGKAPLPDKEAHLSLFLQSALEGRMALICGTSTCHMASSSTPCFIPGVWGPYFGAMFGGLYLNEGGQSAAGALIDHLIDTHAAAAVLKEKAAALSTSRTNVLNGRLEVSSCPPRPTHLIPPTSFSRTNQAHAPPPPPHPPPLPPHGVVWGGGGWF